MADNSLLVTISGAALSLLFYENACSVGDQMGFLLGDVVMYITKNVTDSERHVESVRRHIEITGVLMCPSSGALYDHTGKLLRDKLKSFIREKSKEIVGWFRFRRNNRLVPTFRDKILHKELAAYFNECNASSLKECFLACILNTSMTEKMGIHKFRHVLLHYRNGTFWPVPLRINNLGDDAARLDSSDYIPIPVRLSEEPDVFTKFVKSLNLDLQHKSGSELVTIIQKAAKYHLKSLIPKVCESDREIFEMERQVYELRSKMISRARNLEKFSADNQQVNESNHYLMKYSEGDQSIPMEIKEETPPRTSQVYEDHYADKDSQFSKTKAAPKSRINAMRCPNDSAQKAPSCPFPYSQAGRKSPDIDDFRAPSD